MKKILALVMACVMSISLLAACAGTSGDGTTTTAAGGGETVTTAAAGGGETTAAETLPEIESEEIDPSTIEFDPFELTIGAINDVGSLYPGGPLMTGRKSMQVMIYEPLFWFDPDTEELTPMIAKSYESKGNGTYEIEIFDYVTDSEGNNITADDVIFSITNYISFGQNPNVYATITDYHTTGDYSFEVTFAPESTGQFVAFCTYIYIYSEKAWNESPDGMISYPVATGGYVFDKDNSVSGASYVFNKRADYWQTDDEYRCDRNTFNADKVTIKVITDASTLAMELQNRSVDFVADIAAADRVNFMNDEGPLSGYYMTYGQNNSFVHLSFNCSDASPCGDENLRKAIAYAIDAAACAFTAHGSVGHACTMPSNPGLFDVNESMGSDDYFAYDAATAQDYLSKSDYNGETIKILVQPNVVITSAAPLIKQYLSVIGINVEMLEYDMAQYRSIEADTTGTEYDIKMNGMQATDDYVCKSLQEIDTTAKESGLNQLYINDPELQALYETASNVETNSDESVQALFDYINEHCYIYGLYYGPKVFFGLDSIVYSNSSLPEDNVFGCFIKQ